MDPRSGRPFVDELPAPTVTRGTVLVRNLASVVSAGTERDILAFGRRSLIGKAMDRPDLVRQVVDKMRREGIGQALRATSSRLDMPVELGYSCAGVVLELGAGVSGLAPGDIVACGGAGTANHAEVVAVPEQLCARVPVKNGALVPPEEAAFTTLGAIALHGVRLAIPTLGERVVVMGLGVVGQLACQLLRAHGCMVYALDPDARRVSLARELGADAGSEAGGDDAEGVLAFTSGVGPIELAGAMSRKKGRVVVVGNVGLNVPRRSYYERELALTVSSSYGPGRYDAAYEERGVDYPIAYVRWTEQRNMQAFLDTLANGRVHVGPLITHRFPLERAADAFALIGEEPPEPSLGIILTMGGEPMARQQRTITFRPAAEVAAGRVGVGAIGAGAFARSVLFPELRRNTSASLRCVSAASGVSASAAARRYGFEVATTALDDLLSDPEVHAVFVLTRHSQHAELVLRALGAGKHVFVEKPLCVTREQLEEIAASYRKLADGERTPVLTVGFNRRFAPLARALRAELGTGGPVVMTYRVSAGRIAPGHWLEDPAEGGRIVGEACHFIDLASFLTDALPVRVFATGGRSAAGGDPSLLTIDFADGSVLSLTYSAEGGRALPKERLEVFKGDRSWVLDDWRALVRASDRASRRQAGWTQRKGHAEEIAAFLDSARGRASLPIPFESLLATTMTTFCALQSQRHGVPVDVPVV